MIKAHQTIRLLITIHFYVLVSIGCEVKALSFPQLIQSNRLRRDVKEKGSNTMKLEATSQSDSPSWQDGGKVAVQIVKDISSGASPLEVSEAWMEHHWRRGGGLPIFVTTPPSLELSSTEMKRTIYPIAMKEEILSSESLVPEEKSSEDDAAAASAPPIIIRYLVSEAGPFFADLVPGSHQGTVTISQENKMIWEVEFETTRLRALYQSVTEFTVGIAARTVQEACGPTRLLTLKAAIPSHAATSKESPEIQSKDAPLSLVELRRELLDFFWARGGGLPLLPPIPYGDILKDGGGMARSKLLRIPPAITESIVSTDSYTNDNGKQVAEIVYRLEEPGWLTFPFLLHTHLGRIQLISPSGEDSESSSKQLHWQVEIRPYPFASAVIEKLVDMTICTIVRNFLVHLEEPGVTVPLMIPALETLSSPGHDSNHTMSISIPRASWWGGVIEKLNSTQGGQRQDTNLLDRIVRVVAPWTWGRMGNEDEGDDVVSYSWTSDEKIELQ
ncbi:unnamed protein product [Cylindrotheca closterium]|uniref:Uncharacterized protein n=1 Tax=Cylindrotheca closterium TaxID=2856 RepID=A0AAD2FMA7_9STRA|nr:unnamed protein product [Cylindrotheca closterium]